MKKAIRIETKEKIIKRLLAGEGIKAILAEYPDAPRSLSTWTRLKKAYLAAGIGALEDKRKQKQVKIPQEVKSAIIELKKQQPELSYTQLARTIKMRFTPGVSRSMISIILRQAGFKGKFGRKKALAPHQTPQGRVFPWAGVSFAIAAEQQMGLCAALNSFLLNIAPSPALNSTQAQRIKLLLRQYPYIIHIILYMACMGYKQIQEIPRELSGSR